MDSNGRAYERGLVAIVALVISAACAVTWWDIEQDRATVLATSARLTDSLVESMEGHVQAAMRDARNAASAAALMIERGGGPMRFGGEKRLHDELRRELSDVQSTARLVVADAGGRVLGSSSDYPVGRAELARSGSSWRSDQPAQRSFMLGTPERSPVGDELVLPYTCEIVDGSGRVAGSVRAELRMEHFLSAYRSISSLNQGAVVLMSQDGITLMRAPLDERFLGRRGAGVQAFLDRAAGESGNLEYTPSRDGVTRNYSWRRIEGQPLILAVGLDKDAVLAPWLDRTQRRITLVGVACAAVVSLSALLVFYARRFARSRTQLHEAEQRYWSAMEHSTIGISVATLDGAWQHVNPALCAMTGYSREELLSKSPHSLTAPEFRAARARMLRDFSSGTVPADDRESRVINKDGRYVWVHVHTSMLRDSAGNPSCLLSHVQDITERKHAEQAIQELNRNLERRVAERTAELSRVNQDLEAFSYSAAHDLRGPLGRLSMFIDVLAHDLGQVQPGIARRIESIKRQSTHMTALIEDLLALSRSSRDAVHKVRVDMRALAMDVCDEVGQQAADRNVRWVIQDLPEVHADRALVREALVNLIGNAFKYTRGRDPAVIEIGALPGGEPAKAVFFVQDNGAGFDMEFAGDLFAPFKRLHSVSEFEGTGIGLAIVRRIIERNGGRIWGEGEPGKGARFSFVLRAAP